MPFGEFLGWLGCWFIVQVYPGHHHKDFFSMKPRDKFWTHSCLSDAMSGKIFERTNSCLKLDDEQEAPDHKDRFFWMIKSSKGFDERIDAEFDPSLLVCSYQSVVSFHNHHSPAQVCLDRKHHPTINECHTVSCCETSIILHMELVQVN